MGARVKVKVGCCGFPISKKKYYEEFMVVEVQKTFYKPPKVKTALKWREEAPDEFEFTVKAWMLFTHDPKSFIWRRSGIPSEDGYGLLRPTSKNLEKWEEFLEIVRALKSKVVVFQSPPSFKATEENLKNVRDFFSSIRGDVELIGWEVRHESWKAFLKGLLSDLNLIHVVDPLYELPVYGNPFYFRLHGKREGRRIVYNHKYSEEELEKILRVITEMNRPGYVMFNNGAFMRESALNLLRKLQT